MDKRTVRSVGVSVCSFLGLAVSLFAQNPPIIIQPPGFTLTLPNYLMTPIGQTAGLEGGAFVARANDASSNWYNPAGLALAHESSVSSSAGSYNLLSVVPEDLQSEDSGGSSQQVPALVGVVVKKLFRDPRWTLGFSAVRTNSWEQETDAQVDELALPASRLLSYSADSQFHRNEFSLGMGYADKGPWRFGAALSVANTSLSAVGSVGDQTVTPTGLDAALADRRVSGNITQLRLTGGVQYQITPEILLGALVRTPGLKLFRSGEFGFDAVATEGAETASLSFFDPKPTFDYKLPFQATAGAAWVCSRFQLELDVSFFSGNSPYDLFTSEKTATSIFDNGQGGPPVVEHVPFNPVISDNRAIVNVAFGGSYALTANQVWVLHFGFHTDFSPVGDADEFFSKVDVYSATVGVSGSVAGFTAAIGVNYQFGDANNVPLADILDSDITIKSIAIIYSVAYRF
jgi:hypothetical protein